MPKYSEFNSMVPLPRIIGAAIVDTYEDYNKVYHMYAHWAARGLKKLDNETFQTGIRKVVLFVSQNTMTAALPPDFNDALFVGVIENGIKIPLTSREDLIDKKGVVETECVETCSRCGQDKNYCNELTITEEIETVTINGSNYEQTSVKKLKADGSYIVEKNVPFYSVEGETVTYKKITEFLTTFDMLPCGCVAQNSENAIRLKHYCYDLYCAYCAPCGSCSTKYGGYKIFESTGFIQLDNIGRHTSIYLEYRGFMPKKNGQYMVPEIAFETIVSYLKFKRIENKANIDKWEKEFAFNQYRIERRNMEKIIGRASLSLIIESIGLIPKFDLNDPLSIPYEVEESAIVSSTESISQTTQSESPVTVVTQAPVASKQYVPFSIATKVGIPGGLVVEESTFQDNRLKDALNLTYIIVNNIVETYTPGQWVLDSVNGILTRYQNDGVTPNKWQEDDELIMNFYKYM